MQRKNLNFAPQSEVILDITSNSNFKLVSHLTEYKEPSFKLDFKIITSTILATRVTFEFSGSKKCGIKRESTRYGFSLRNAKESRVLCCAIFWELSRCLVHSCHLRSLPTKKGNRRTWPLMLNRFRSAPRARELLDKEEAQWLSTWQFCPGRLCANVWSAAMATRSPWDKARPCVFSRRSQRCSLLLSFCNLFVSATPVPSIGEHALSGQNSAVCERVVGLWTKTRIRSAKCTLHRCQVHFASTIPFPFSVVLSLASAQNYLQLHPNEGFICCKFYLNTSLPRSEIFKLESELHMRYQRLPNRFNNDLHCVTLDVVLLQFLWNPGLLRDLEGLETSCNFEKLLDLFYLHLLKKVLILILVPYVEF